MTHEEFDALLTTIDSGIDDALTAVVSPGNTERTAS